MLAAYVIKLTRGSGNCRITGTRQPNVRRALHVNRKDARILNTIEVCDIPEVALASQEDCEDSIARPGECPQLMPAPDDTSV